MRWNRLRLVETQILKEINVTILNLFLRYWLFRGTWVSTNLNLFQMVYFWNFCNEYRKSCDWEILWGRNTLVAFYLQPWMFMSLDQLQRTSWHILIALLYISYLTTPKKILKIDLVCPIVIKRIKSKLKQILTYLPSYAALTRP